MRADASPRAPAGDGGGGGGCARRRSASRRDALGAAALVVGLGAPARSRAAAGPEEGAGSGAGPAMPYAGSSMPTWQLYTGLVAGLFPIVIASYEFGKRWLIQARCETCGGTGLVAARRREGSTAPVRKVKCRECGGFLPWESWELFLSSDAGNGGPLRQPRGQTSVFYKVPPPPPSRPAPADGARDGDAAPSPASPSSPSDD